MLVLAWENCRNRSNIEQMPEKKVDRPGLLSVQRCVISDRLLWALVVALTPVSGREDCSSISQAFLRLVFASPGHAYRCLYSTYSCAGGHLHRTAWPDFAGGWLGSEKLKKMGLNTRKSPGGKGEQRRKCEECGEKRDILFKLGSQFGIEAAHGKESKSR